MRTQLTYNNKESSRFSQTLVFVLALLLLNNLIVNKINRMKRKRPSLEFLQNTLITTTIGILFGLLLRLLNAKTIEATIKNTFEPLFLIVLLPPILYSSALKMNQFYFFKNFGSITLFAFLGTLLAITTNTLLMYLWTQTGLGFQIPFHYCLVFSTLISATDPVSVLATFEGSAADPNLYSLIFGECIFNDAISLGIYRSILIDEKGSQSKAAFVLDTTLRFTATVIMSTILGVGIGLLAAYLLKKVNRFTSISESQIGTMSRILEISDWEDYSESDSSIESDEKEICSIEEPRVIKQDDIHYDRRFDTAVNSKKEDTELARIKKDMSQNVSELGLNSIIREQAIPQSYTQSAIDGSTVDNHTKTQVRIFKQHVSNFNNYLNQEITISLISPLMAYLVAEVR